MPLLFVYGTLKTGQRANYMLDGASLVGEHRTEPKYHMIDLGWYPAILHNGVTPIHGEVWALEEIGDLQSFDTYEGYPDLYYREEIETPYGLAWMYVMRSEIGYYPEVLSGDWGI